MTIASELKVPSQQILAFLFKAPLAPISLVLHPTSFTAPAFNHPGWDHPHDASTPVPSFTEIVHLSPQTISVIRNNQWDLGLYEHFNQR
ncbi:hypothetical protein FRC04_004228 [Tulasnella sp. 424]|nr:hypothetical protein FRC04_004228 [Tulasnella sp. 424]